MKEKGNRSGKHKPGKVRVQLVIERRTKAILVYTAARLNKTLTDLMIDGGMRVAMATGVVDSDCKVLPNHVDGVDVVESILMKQEGDK